MIVKLGEVQFKVIGKERYCRWFRCNTNLPRCLKKHRSGIWFKIVASVGGKSTLFIIGEGEKEFSFPFDEDVRPIKELSIGPSGVRHYDKAHVTSSGWHSIESPLFLTSSPLLLYDAGEEVYLDDQEQIVLMRLLNEQRKEIMFSLVTQEIVDPLTKLGAWEDLKPFVYYCLNTKPVELPLDATIERDVGISAEFKWGNIEFSVPKKTEYEICTDAPMVIVTTPRVRIIYGEVFGRKIAYRISSNSTIGFEEYNDIVHEPCRIDGFHDPWEVKYLFDRRLGDLLFLKDGELENYIEERLLIPATGEQFRKIGVIRGRFDSEEMKISDDEGITIYHPEHGLLELASGTYKVYRVPYISKGHGD